MENSCFICENENSVVLEEHHVVPKWLGGSDGDLNTYQLCRNCHHCIEQMYDRNFWSRLHLAIETHPSDEPLKSITSHGRSPGGLWRNEDDEIVIRDKEVFLKRSKAILLRERGVTIHEVEDRVGVASSTIVETVRNKEKYKRAADEWPPEEIHIQPKLQDTVE